MNTSVRNLIISIVAGLGLLGILYGTTVQPAVSYQRTLQDQVVNLDVAIGAEERWHDAFVQHAAAAVKKEKELGIVNLRKPGSELIADFELLLNACGGPNKGGQNPPFNCDLLMNGLGDKRPKTAPVIKVSTLKWTDATWVAVTPGSVTSEPLAQEEQAVNIAAARVATPPPLATPTPKPATNNAEPPATPSPTPSTSPTPVPIALQKVSGTFTWVGKYNDLLEALNMLTAQQQLLVLVSSAKWSPSVGSFRSVDVTFSLYRVAN